MVIHVPLAVNFSVMMNSKDEVRPFCLSDFLFFSSRPGDDQLSGPSLPEGGKEEDEGVLMDNPVAQRGGKKGKKDRKKKDFDDDWYSV